MERLTHHEWQIYPQGRRDSSCQCVKFNILRLPIHFS